jgi:Rps23 Pro-64 3,4-dihydroxylase Tpa1-like proline 4-hydroxylase
MNRTAIADLIIARMQADASQLADAFGTPGQIPSCVLRDVLPPDVTARICAAFPDSDRMILKRSLKENKHIAAQMDQFDPLLEEVVFAFQDPRVLALVAEITGLAGLEPDSNLYAGGISAMQQGAYLRPHLDNSHDSDRQRYRVLNLLFYVTPGWREEDGGNLQLWDDGPTGTPRTIASAFNSLVIMLTNRASWHSVSEVVGEGRRCCVSNYYFSRQSPDAEDYFHATSFRGEYGRGVADKVMQADNAMRTAILRSAGGRIWRNPHVYVRPDTHES